MAEKIYVSLNNERIEATGDLLAEILEAQAESKRLTAEREAKEKTKAEARALLFDRLGITEDEAKLLLS